MLEKTLLILALPAAGALAQPLTSAFDASREGWTVETRTDPRGAFTLVRSYTPDFIASGGDPGGYIEELDPDSSWSFFAAPDAWSGDRSAFLGRRLSYSVRTNVVDYPDGRLIVLIGAGGQKVSLATDIPPTGVWARRSVVLAEGAWRVGSSGVGAVATSEQIQAVLGSLTRLLIGLEFGADALQELVGLDQVAFGECPADFNGDGFLDFFDYDEYVNCFETGACPPGRTADFNGDGFADFFDYDDFVAAFEAGC